MGYYRIRLSLQCLGTADALRQNNYLRAAGAARKKFKRLADFLVQHTWSLGCSGERLKI